MASHTDSQKYQIERSKCLYFFCFIEAEMVSVSSKKEGEGKCDVGIIQTMHKLLYEGNLVEI